jgi:hypothetical protein
MSKRLAERNRLIAKLYDPKRRNGQELADRFGISRVRINQIIKEEGVNTVAEKYTGRIPVVMIEEEKEETLRAIADAMGLTISVLVRWGVDWIIKTYSHHLTGEGIEPVRIVSDSTDRAKFNHRDKR